MCHFSYSHAKFPPPNFGTKRKFVLDFSQNFCLPEKRSIVSKMVINMLYKLAANDGRTWVVDIEMIHDTNRAISSVVKYQLVQFGGGHYLWVGVWYI